MFHIYNEAQVYVGYDPQSKYLDMNQKIKHNKHFIQTALR